MASVGAAGSFSFDPDSVQSAAGSIQRMANTTAGIRQQCAHHHQHAQNLLEQLGQVAIMELDPTEHERLWSELGFDALRAAIEGTQNELGGLRTQLDDVRRMLLDTHTGVLSAKLQDEFDPLSACLADSHNHAASASRSVVFENLVSIALGYIDLPMTLFLMQVALGRAYDEADALHSVLDWLWQQELGLVNLNGVSIRDLWNWAFAHPSHSAAPSASGGAKPTTQPQSPSDTVATDAHNLAGGLQKGTDGAYNSYLKNGTNTYPGDKALAESVFASSGNYWSWSNIQCVAFVWLVYASAYPKDWRKMLLPIGDSSAGTGSWAVYGSAKAKALGWHEIPNGQPAQAGDIIVMQARDSKGNDLSWGHVAIVQSVSATTTTPDGHTHATMTVVQSNAGNGSTVTFKMTDGKVDPGADGNNFLTLGYLRYTPPATP